MTVDYQKLGILGEGSHARVFLAENSDGMKFALKKFEIPDNSKEEIPLSEPEPESIPVVKITDTSDYICPFDDPSLCDNVDCSCVNWKTMYPMPEKCKNSGVWFSVLTPNNKTF